MRSDSRNGDHEAVAFWMVAYGRFDRSVHRSYNICIQLAGIVRRGDWL